MLTLNDIKEELSYAFLHTVASRAGFGVTRPGKDRDSIDAVIEASGLLDESSLLMSPRIEIQLKSHVMNKAPSGEFSYPLPIKNYNDLRGRRSLPRLLVILGLPKQRARWVELTADALIARRCAYWCSLVGLPDVTNKRTRSVTVSCNNLLTPESIRSLMVRASTGQPILP